MMQMPPDIFKTYSVKRYAVGTVDSTGTYSKGAETTVSITANIQPEDSQSRWQRMQTMPEGQREEAAIIVITDSELVTVEDAGEDQSPDIVVYESQDWEVNGRQPFGHMTIALAHYEYLATRIG